MTIPQILPRIRPQLAEAATSARRHTLSLVCASFFALALALRLYRLGAQSLWLDEGGTWMQVTGKGLLALLGELFSKDAAYPLYHLLLKGWVGLAGDSEWALRLPSALAGAAATVAIFLAADEIPRTKEDTAASPFRERPGRRTSSFPFVAALLFAVSPFALWYAQDAKVYSLLMLMAALELWALLRALRRDSRRDWLLALGIAVASVFVHRLALLNAAAAALAYVVVWPAGRTADRRPTTNDQRPTTAFVSFVDQKKRIRDWYSRGAGGRALRIGLGLGAIALGAASVAGTILAVRGESQEASGHIPAGPLQGLWLSFAHFSLDRGDIDGMLGLPLAAWALPCVVLTFWGVLLLLRDAARGSRAAGVVVCMLAAPLALFAVALAFARVYEARYATVAFPAWILVLAYPFSLIRQGDKQTRRSRAGSQEPEAGNGVLRPASFILPPSSLILPLVLCAALAVDALVLFQPEHGLFSGAPVKEQWRDAIAELARRAHPDDLVILHPYYASPMWAYYAPRVTPDPLPAPVSFLNFKEGYLLGLPLQVRKQRAQREYEPSFNAAARGKKRALLLIAPDHARTIDPPDETLHDKYGWVGLRFQYSADQRTWPCGGAAFVGVEVMCQSYPEAFKTGAIPQPSTRLEATFGGELRLRGYSLDLAGGAARAGGTLPITLYWEAAAVPTHDYRMFLHLCRDCEIPPLANADGPPLDGYGDAGRTTTWRVGDPVHDERAVCLPAGLAPGSYTLLLGVYPADDPSAAARLPVVSGAPAPGGTRLVLGEVQVEPAAGGAALTCR